VKRRPIPFNDEMNVLMCKDLMVNRPKLRRVAFNSDPASLFNAGTLLYFLTHCKIDEVILYPYVWEPYDILEKHGSAARIGFLDFDEITRERFYDVGQGWELEMDNVVEMEMMEVKVMLSITMLGVSRARSSGKKRRPEKCSLKVMTLKLPTEMEVISVAAIGSWNC